MSWHFSRALEEEFLRENSSAGELSARWKSVPSAPDDSCSAKMKVTCHRSPYGMMYVHSADKNGEELLTWYLVGFRAKTLHPQAPDSDLVETEADYGLNSQELSQNQRPPSHSLKIVNSLQDGVWTECSKIWPKWGTMRNGVCWAAQIAERGIKENEFGFSLPTIGANEYKGSSRVRFLGSSQYRGAKMSEGLRICEQDPIYTHPNFAEEAMGWPITWTASTPLEMDKYQSWLQRHGIFYQQDWLAEL